MTADKIIDQIISKHPEISRSTILERLEVDKRKTGGFISEETLLRVIAVELGVEVSHNEVLAPTLSLGGLIPNLNDVTVVGRVVAVFPTRAFEGGRSGKLASLLIADEDDILRIVFWDDKTSLLESGGIRVGQVIRVSHGYTREDRGGRVEVHVGDKSEVEVNPRGIEAKDYPTISKFTTKIEKITRACVNRRINVDGTVKGIFSASAFQRQDLSYGKVMRLMLADETGELSVVVWNDKVEELENTVKNGSRLQIVNAKVKKASGEGLEIHVNSDTFVEVLASTEKVLKIADLREGLNRVNVEGEVFTKPVCRDVKTSKGELMKLAVFELKDETGKIWVSAWREHADLVKGFKVGERMIIKGASAKKGFGDRLEVSTRDATSISLVQGSAR